MDPLALLDLQPGLTGRPAAGWRGRPRAGPRADFRPGRTGTVAVPAPMQGVVISYRRGRGRHGAAGPAGRGHGSAQDGARGRQRGGRASCARSPWRSGDTIFEGTPILFIEPREADGAVRGRRGARPGGDPPRPGRGPAPALPGHRRGRARRPPAKRHAQGRRTIRENIADLCDPGTFTEYGPTVTAARLRSDSWQTLEERMLRTAADGMVIGVGQVNGELVGPQNARCAVVAYDYSVLAGTQGGKNHQKTDRMLRIAQQYRLPVVLYSEGGGGRAGGGSGPSIPEGAARVDRRAVHAHLARARQAVRAGADRRRQLRLLLRRQRRAAGRLRRHHRHPGQLHRHRRPGHDRGRRAGRLRPRRGRAGQHPGAQRRDRHRGRGRGRGHRGRPRTTCPTSRAAPRTGARTTSCRCATSSRRTGARSTTSAP